MKKYKLLVLTNCTPGSDAEFNRWYSEVHIPDVLKVPGFTGAIRARLSPPSDEGTPAHRYCAIYDFESDDPAATLEGLSARAGTDQMTMSDTLDMDTIGMTAWEVI